MGYGVSEGHLGRENNGGRSIRPAAVLAEIAMIQLQMPKNYAVISPELRSRILDRSAAAANQREIADGIFDELLAASVDPFAVSLEQYKVLLVEAVRAARAPWRQF